MSLNPMPNLPQEHSLLSQEHYHCQVYGQFLPVTYNKYAAYKEQEQVYFKKQQKLKVNKVLISLYARQRFRRVLLAYCHCNLHISLDGIPVPQGEKNCVSSLGLG